MFSAKLSTPLLALAACLLLAPLASAQKTVVSGKITDEQGEGLPMVNIVFAGTKPPVGTTTNFDGVYQIETAKATDTLVFSSVGYKTEKRVVKVGARQEINLQMFPKATMLETAIVKANGGDPVKETIRDIMRWKKRNDPRNLKEYDYDAYTRIQMDVDNISEKFAQKKVVRQVLEALDTAGLQRGEDGRPMLPVFLSESGSKIWQVHNPLRRKEHITVSQVAGVGLSDESAMAQYLSALRPFNFYENWVTMLGKDFVSPIADGWDLFYRYDTDWVPTDVEGEECILIQFEPRQEQDAAFKGLMWISTQDSALVRITASVGKEANLNFIEKVKISQDYARTDAGPWVPAKTRVTLDVGEIRDDWAGMLIKYYHTADNIRTNQDLPAGHFNETITVEPDAFEATQADIDAVRTEKLTAEELQTKSQIDLANDVPLVRTYVDVIEIAVNGYKAFGPIEVGPYLYAYSHNQTEGHRFRLGFRTNGDLSKRVYFRGYGAYGTLDKEFKYMFESKFILSRKAPWTEFGLRHYNDIDRVGIFSDRENNNTPLFNAFLRWGDLQQPFRHTISAAWIQSDIIPEVLIQTVKLRNRRFDPLYEGFSFINPESDSNEATSRFTTTELLVQTRFALGERYYKNNYARQRQVVDKSYPTITLSYTHGMNDFMGGELSYDKFDVSLEHNIRFGALGNTDYSVQAGYIPSTVPYPLLETHLGNESVFYNSASFNMMDFLEFASDTYASIKMTHRFEGLITNRIPFLKKLKTRSLASLNVLYGSVRDENREIYPEGVDSFNALNRETPYIEAGYGIENIFKFIRVDVLHRVTYLRDNAADNIGFRVSAQFRL